MTDPARDGWPLRGLVHCGYCEYPMDPSRWLAGPRAYQCGFPCARSRVDAAGLEMMAYQAALTTVPGADRPPPDDLTALIAQVFARIVVHGGLSDVRFVNR